MRERCGEFVADRAPQIQTLNSVGLWICNEFGGQGRLRVLEEPQVRDLIQRVYEVRRQSNTDTVLPYIDALSAVRLGLASPTTVEDGIPDARGLEAGFDKYRAALEEAGTVDFDEQIYRAIEILPPRSRRSELRTTPLPTPPGRRIPRPERGAHVADPAVVRPPLQLLWRGRRRSGHLRLRGQPPST